MPSIEQPRCLAMILCEVAHYNAPSRMFSLLGAFSNCYASTFPFDAKFDLFLSLASGSARCEMGVRIVEASSLDEVFDRRFEVSFASRIDVLDLSLEVEVRFPASGVYHCELYAAGETILSRRLTIIDPQQPTGTT